MRETTRQLNGRWVESADADNALATVTVAAVAGVRHFIAGVAAHYSAPIASAIKTIQIKFGTTVVANLRWNPALDACFRFPFPVDIHGDYNQAVSAELTASGTGTVLGRVALLVSSE